MTSSVDKITLNPACINSFCASAFLVPSTSRSIATQENPAVTIGGLKRPKYRAGAQAGASPIGVSTAQFACTAQASAEPVKRF